MDIQEAMRQLMRRVKDEKKDKKENRELDESRKLYQEDDAELKAGHEYLTEDIEDKSKRKKEPILSELWDQVYCTLVDAGDNKIYEICGGKGKYNPSEATVKNAEGKYGDNIISIIYDKTDKEISEDSFFDDAIKIANKFGLRTNKTNKGSSVLFNVYLPQGEPVYFDLIPEKFREKIAIENGEDLEDLPTSPGYSGEALVVESFEYKAETMSTEDFTEWHEIIGPRRDRHFFDKVQKIYDIFSKYDNKEEDIEIEYTNCSPEDKLAITKIIKREESFDEDLTEDLTEDLNVELPVKILPENDILEFIDSVPKATAQRGPASLTFTVGFVKEVDVAGQFKDGGRGHVNKETGETLPVVSVVKCSEISGLYLESYSSSKKTIAYRRQKEKEQEENPVEEPKRDFVSWLDHVEGHRNLFKSKKTGELVLVPLMAANSRSKARYFISIDGQPLRQTTKDEIIPYLTPAKQAEIINGKEEKPNGPAQPLTFYLKKIYIIGNKGASIF